MEGGFPGHNAAFSPVRTLNITCCTVVILLSYSNKLHKPKRIVYTGGMR